MIEMQEEEETVRRWFSTNSWQGLVGSLVLPRSLK